MFRLVNGGERLPQRATRFSAGFDVFANEDAVIGAGETVTIGLGICIDPKAQLNVMGKHASIDNLMDVGLYLELHLRSSLRVKGLGGGVGIIDMDYRDEIKMVINNPITDVVSTEEGVYYNGADNYSTYRVKRGDKIGQLILKRHEGHLLSPSYTLDVERNGGFGSTND